MAQKTLTSMEALLTKLAEQTAQKGLMESDLLEARLAPDMFPFVRQIQIMCDNAKGAFARLAGVDIPSREDKETTLAQLLARIAWTKEYIAGLGDASLETAHDQKIVLPYIDGKYQSAQDYVRDFFVPNFYFHATIAYAIARMQGYDIGKMDFIGGLNLQDL